MSIPSFITYLEHEKKYSPHTIEAYKADLDSFYSFCQEQFNQIELEFVSYPLIRNWIISLVELSVSNRSINRKMSSLNSYYNFLMKTKQIKENPLQNHKALKVSKTVNIPFSKTEINEVFELVHDENDFESVRNKLMIEMFYSTGMRRAELISLKLSDIDIPQRTVKVLGKRNKERYIPFLKLLVPSIEKYLSMRNDENVENEYFFVTKKRKKLYPTLVYRVINDYFSKVSSKTKKSPHIIRHSFATHLLNEGADLNSVKELLGHSSLASTQVYTHNSLSKLKQMYNHAHPRSNKNKL